MGLQGWAEIGPSQVVLRFALGTFVWIAFLAVQVGPGWPANDVAMDALDRILLVAAPTVAIVLGFLTLEPTGV